MAKTKSRAKSIRMTDDVRERYDRLVASEGIEQSELINGMIDAYVTLKDKTADVVSQEKKSHASDNNTATKNQQPDGIVIDETAFDRISSQVTQSVTSRIETDLSTLFQKHSANAKTKHCMADDETVSKINSGISAILANVKNNADELRSYHALSEELQTKVDGLSEALSTISATSTLTDRVADAAGTLPAKTDNETADIWDSIQPALSAIHTAESNIHQQLSDFNEVIEELRAEHKTLGSLRQEIHMKDQLIRIKDDLIEMLKASKSNKPPVT